MNSNLYHSPITLLRTRNSASPLALCASLLLTVAARAELPSTITTIDGEVFNGVTLVRAEPDGYLVNYQPQNNGLGMAKIKFSRLPVDLQKEAHYDPDKAREFEQKVAKANEEVRQETIRLEAFAKSETQARQVREAQDESLAIQRITALAELKMAEANLASQANGNGNGNWSSLGGGAIAIPEVALGGYSDHGNTRDFKTYYNSSLNQVPRTLVKPAYYPGKPILSPFTPAR